MAADVIPKVNAMRKFPLLAAAAAVALGIRHLAREAAAHLGHPSSS